MNPHAKLIFVVRDPIDTLFSTECMLRNFGVALPWTLSDRPDAPHTLLARGEAGGGAGGGGGDGVGVGVGVGVGDGDGDIERARAKRRRQCAEAAERRLGLSQAH